MEASLRLVEEILPGYGFSQENVELTNKIIKNSFSDHQECLSDNILHDARYDYLGRVDYIKLTEKLLRERTEFGKHTDTKTWIDSLIMQQKEHQFMTKTGRLLRNVTAEDQIAELQK
jgi:hypothetical protein